MKKQQTRSAAVWKSSLTLTTVLLVAACMQHEESLRPVNAPKVAEELNSEAQSGTSSKRTFTAHLTASNELPTATGPVESLAQGQAIFKVSEDGSSIHYKILVANLKGATVAHIHCNPAGTNGVPFVFLFGPVSPVDVNGVLAEGEFTQADLIARADAANCVGGLATMEDVIERMRNGTSYLNVHTVKYPGGEIRGQIR